MSGIVESGREIDVSWLIKELGNKISVDTFKGFISSLER